MKKKRRLKRTFRQFIWLMAGIGFIIILSASTNHQYDQQLQTESAIRINYKDGNFFISEEEIHQILIKHLNGTLDGHKIRDLDISGLETEIEKNPYVKQANVYTDIHGTLTVKVVQRKPVLRVINRKGVSYYLDDLGEKIPITPKFTSRVPLATGIIADNGLVNGKIETDMMKDLLLLALKIRPDSFLEPLVEQVYVNREGEYELIPGIDRLTIRLGDLSNLDEKLDKLKLYYKKGIEKVGWNRYKSIDLRFKNQIVCKKA